MLRSTFSALLVLVTALLQACAGAGGFEISTYSTVPVRPQVDPYLLPAPRISYSVMPPGSRVVDVQCAIGDATQSWHRGRVYSNYGRSCVVTFVTRQRTVCTTNASESGGDQYGGSSGSRSASAPSCRALTADEKIRWQIN